MRVALDQDNAITLTQRLCRASDATEYHIMITVLIPAQY
jgi:hypothetical protein